MIRSWHDFHITGYVVSGKSNEIVFDLEWPYELKTDVRRAKLHFGGVEGYFLEHDLGGNIVYAFSEVPLPDFLRDQTERFEANHKWAWPKFWRPKPFPERPLEIEVEDAHAWLVARSIKCIQLDSSYGLSGWVLAATVRDEVIEA